jgi:dephospho-CoA kinase
MNNIYILGGSPCCGKSTIAERLYKKYKFQYYKVDNFLDKYIKKGANDGDKWLKYIVEMTMDELWLRDYNVLHDEEYKTYERLMPYFISDLENLNKDIPIITEGAAFLPNLIYQLKMYNVHYLCIVPTKEFQINQYRKRHWVKEYLSPCSNKEVAFNNWMERDALFAVSVLKKANDLGYKSLVVDGKKTLDEIFLIVEKYFCL